ncbi:antitoxin [Gordonia sp. TBRC 11910]|uniref:Antitoxin n=1 Tax=Gordonia asplenii TaxID=2725283 RepID=A0A848L7A0_9ACTN|nr:antitoxin [Gordonia asplenii]NMO04875.1 antitoxin [Gordonia asplenii]
MSRTTITLDSDVEAMLHKAMRERGITFKDAVNDAIRQGLGRSARPVGEISFPTYSMGRPRVDLTHSLALAAELEDDEVARKLEQGR